MTNPARKSERAFGNGTDQADDSNRNTVALDAQVAISAAGIIV
jgi:hypothetical protein